MEEVKFIYNRIYTNNCVFFSIFDQFFNGNYKKIVKFEENKL